MSRDSLLFIAVFLASAVEGVEAVTIVLAAGLTRGWRSALAGAGVASVVLAAIVAVLGPALTALPIDVLRLVVGALLLTFGLQWLRKAILRASGFKALRDEDAIFAAQLAADRAVGQEPRGIDGYGFTVSFKGVLLEGLEVAFIVVTFGSNEHNVPLAAIAACAAAVLVVAAGVAVRAPLSRVPENTLKFAVGVMLKRLRHFLGSRGGGGPLAGRRRCDSRLDPAHACCLDRARGGDAAAARPTALRQDGVPGLMGWLRALATFFYDFVVGDDYRIAVAVVVALGFTAAAAGAGISAWWVLPAAVIAVLGFSIHRATSPRSDRLG